MLLLYIEALTSCISSLSPSLSHCDTYIYSQILPLFSHDEADENVFDDDDDVDWVSGVSRLSLSEQNQAGLFYVCFNIPVSSSRQHSSSIEEALRGHDMMMMMIQSWDKNPHGLKTSRYYHNMILTIILIKESVDNLWNYNRSMSTWSVPVWPLAMTWWSSLWWNIMIPKSTLVIKYEINRLHGMPTFWKVQGKANFGKMLKNHNWLCVSVRQGWGANVLTGSGCNWSLSWAQLYTVNCTQCTVYCAL